MEAVNDKMLEQRIEALDKKMDLILEYVHHQKMNSNMVEDLIGDLSIIGKDAYDSTVRELDNRQVVLEPAELTNLAVSFLRKIGNINKVLETLEMAVDLG